MGRVKKGQRVQRKDLCAVAGGMNVLVRTMKSFDISNRDTDYSSEIWSELSLALFGQDHKKNRHWLWVMWSGNRNGIRDLLSKQQEKTETTEKERHVDVEVCNQDNVTENLHLSMIDNIEPGSDENTENNDAKDERQNVSLQLKVVQVDEAVTDAEDISDKDEAEEEHHNVSLQSIVVVDEAVTDAEDMSDKDEAEEEHHNVSLQSIVVVDEAVTDAEDRQRWGRRRTSQCIFAEYCCSRRSSHGCRGHVRQRWGRRRTSQCIFAEYCCSRWNRHRCRGNISQRWGKRTTHVFTERSTTWTWKNRDKETMEKVASGFKEVHHYSEQEEMAKNCSTAWFKQTEATMDPCIVQQFQTEKSQHIKTRHSRKINSPYLSITAVCTFASCSAKYYFKRKREPLGNTPVKISVLQRGNITHTKRERKFRPASNTRRGRIARALHKGVSQFFYSKLKNTPVPELISGNITRSLNKNVLKMISSEVQKSNRIHADVLMEMYLTQSIMKECDFQFNKMPGYIQHFQVDPFGVHMYTETGISIVVQHLRKKTPLTLYLDATGNVASKVPGQTKRLLYYSLTLPGCGQNVPPLPACEMLTNEHSIPQITFWLMQFLRKLSQYTKLKVHQVETDYSWALLQSVMLAFNRESIVSYLDRSFDICSKLKTWKDIRTFTVLHLCSAHVLKAVTQSIGRKTADKVLKDFATFAFARLQNSTSMSTALKIFRALCYLANTTPTLSWLM